MGEMRCSGLIVMSQSLGRRAGGHLPDKGSFPNSFELVRRKAGTLKAPGSLDCR